MRGVSGDVLQAERGVASRDCGATAAGRLRDPNAFGLAAGAREGAAWSGGTVGHMTPGPSAENRHGGAPRGAVPVARDGPRLASAVSRLASATGLPSAPFGAPPTPRSGVGTKRKENPAQKRATGMKKTALFDTVNSERSERHRQRRARGQSRRRQRTRSRPRARFAAPSLLRLCTPALENFPQPLRRHRQAGDGARYADRIVDGRRNCRADRVDAAFACPLQAERIER